MKKSLMLLTALFCILISNAENCKDYYFYYSLPTNIKFTTQNVSSFTTDIDYGIIKYIYTFGNGANLIVTANNDPLTDREYTAEETLSMLKEAFSGDNADFAFVSSANKRWVYVKSIANGTGGRWTDNGKVKTTRGYFVTANGSDDINVVVTAPASSYNNYEETMIRFVKSITFTGKRNTKRVPVTPQNSNNNTSGNNISEDTKVKTPNTIPPTPLSEKDYRDAFPYSESSLRSAELYLYRNGISIFEKINSNDVLFDFAIYENGKFHKIVSKFPETNISNNYNELSWNIYRNQVDNADLIVLMTGNRQLDNSCLLPAKVFKQLAARGDKDNYILDLKVKTDASKVLSEYQQSPKKALVDLKSEEKAAVVDTTPAAGN